MKQIHFVFPELLLLLVPLLVVFFWRGRTHSALGSAVRLAMLVLVALLAAVPLLRLGGKGTDVVVVADLSRSMPPDSRSRIQEIIKLLEQRRGDGDRVGLVTFGREARIERLPEAIGNAGDFIQQVDEDGSDLGNALSMALSIIPRERPGRIIVLSDGEANGAPPRHAAHEAAVRGIPVDFRHFSRGESADLAVESLDLPPSVLEREPFQFSVWVRADRSAQAEAVLSRDGVEIARHKQTFRPGATRLVFRDVNEIGGVAKYRLELRATNDRVPENNIGEGAVRVEAPPAILVVNATGQPSNFSRALAAGKLRVRTVTPSEMPRDAAGLDAYRAVVLENVPAGDVGTDRLAMLVKFVTELGGGLLVTGGGASFGVGGYFKSTLDPYLPVSMELRNEHRKLSLAMAIALDRSGSMMAPVGGGRTKMDLANLGACAAIETLGPFDEVAVIAVDSVAHVIVPLMPAKDKEGIMQRVRRIRSEGGGIFTYTALLTAAKMVERSDKGTRHIVIFADAADAEEPGEYKRLTAELQRIGITVSVIGLGTEKDPDAEFLKDLAKRGGGRVHFTNRAEDLPRVFAQEAITVARSSFVSELTPTQTLGDLVLLGEAPKSQFPSVDGFNLTYARPGATTGVITTDEYKAPIVAFWHRGLGRVAALTAEVDGKYSRSLNQWKDFGAFSVGLGRWLLGGEPPQGAQVTVEREGGQGIVRVELDPDRKRGGDDDIRSATAMIVAPGDEPSEKLNLAWSGEHVLEGRFPLRKPGIYLGAVDLGNGRILRVPPLSLPYSPEFEPRTDANEGRRTLEEIARITGGAERTGWDDAFKISAARHREVRDLIFPLALGLIVLHLVEIGGRRLGLFTSLTMWLRFVRVPQWRRARVRKPPQVGDKEGAAPEPSGPIAAPSAEPPPAATDAALRRAKEKARRRLGGRE